MTENLSCSLTAKNLEVNYENFTALKCPEAKMDGTILAVVGHNGAGKSTLIKTILGLLVPKRGNIAVTLHDSEKNYLLTPEDHMAFCPETGSVFADITVETYVKLWCRLKHRDAKFYLKEGSELVEQLELAPLFQKLGRQLSKGQRRRVQTAIGFLCKPKFFLFDEPFDGLDVQRTHELANLIRDHSRKTCFFVSSHRMDVMERLADSLVVLKEGEIIASGPVEKVSATLCGGTYLVLFDGDSKLEVMRKLFPGALVYPLGRQIAITGKGIEDKIINERLQGSGHQLISCEEIRPSLVDAMNYHLMALGSELKGRGE
jgi:ABC-2 type transport system ATP-binding protein